MDQCLRASLSAHPVSCYLTILCVAHDHSIIPFLTLNHANSELIARPGTFHKVCASRTITLLLSDCHTYRRISLSCLMDAKSLPGWPAVSCLGSRQNQRSPHCPTFAPIRQYQYQTYISTTLIPIIASEENTSSCPRSVQSVQSSLARM